MNDLEVISLFIVLVVVAILFKSLDIIFKPVEDFVKILKSSYDESQQKRPKVIAEDALYMFCLDWSMGIVSKEELKKRFLKLNWDYEEFRRATTLRHWYVPSMDILATLRVQPQSVAKYTS